MFKSPTQPTTEEWAKIRKRNSENFQRERAKYPSDQAYEEAQKKAHEQSLRNAKIIITITAVFIFLLILGVFFTFPAIGLVGGLILIIACGVMLGNYLSK
jgi:hypothetical protein